MVGSPGKCPQTISDADLMQQWACLVEMKPAPKIEVAPVVIPAPEVEEVHRSTALSAAHEEIAYQRRHPKGAVISNDCHRGLQAFK